MDDATRPAGWRERLKLIVITSDESDLGRGHEDVASAALEAGCKAVQLRDKQLSDRAFTAIASRIQVLCDTAGAVFIVNDRVDVAAALGCGVHLGVNDLEVQAARRVLGQAAIIGYSPESIAEARDSVSEGADYLGIGPVYPTDTKEDAGDAIGIEGVLLAVRENLAPVIAVGGIKPENAAALAQAGTAGIAVISAVSRARDMREAARELIEAFERSIPR